MGDKNFGEQMNTLFSLEGIRQDEYKPGEVVADPVPRDRPMGDVLFRLPQPEFDYELVVPIDETSIFQESSLVEPVTYHTQVELPVQTENS